MNPNRPATSRLGRLVRRGMTLIDLMMTVTVIGIVIVVVSPSMAPEEKLRLVAASTVLVADIEYAQSATLSAPADPTVVRFDTKGIGYWLAKASDPETPIQRPSSSKPYQVFYGMGDAETLDGISLDPAGVENATITFDAFGRLSVLTDASVVLSGSDGKMEISVTATTGSVRMRKFKDDSELKGDDVKK